MNIALIGYGKMGKAIEKIAIKRNHKVSCIVGLEDSIEKLATADVDVAIEFTQPDAAVENIQYCLKNNIPVISGTTGWLEKYDDIAALCEKENGTFLHASNYSLGVNLFFMLNEWLANKMNTLTEYTPEMEEIHHTEKKDSPSGTALKLMEGLLSQNDHYNGWLNEKSTEPHKVGIISKRIANVPGTHTVSYVSDKEKISITHEAYDRSIFAEGSVLVAEWIKDKKGVFQMKDFLSGVL